MKLALMQPYFFPYLGYWQLIHSVDKFVIYDDVNYIKGGWINRNRILVNEQANYITLPIIKSSQNKKINDLFIQKDDYWKNKILKKIKNTYRKSSNFLEVYPLIEKIISYENTKLSDYLRNQIIVLSNYMGIDTEIIASSTKYHNSNLKAQNRVLDICITEKASIYINPEGGESLYSKADFEENNIKLYFLQMKSVKYPQHTKEFMPYLSIIDVLMEVNKDDLTDYLNSYKLFEQASICP